MPATALDLAQTQGFIAYRPSTVMIKRGERTKTDAGGYKLGEPEEVGEIELRVVEMLRIQGREQRLSAGGELITPTHMAIMMPDQDVLRHDIFDWDDMTWEVLWISKLPDWRWQLELVGRG